MNDLKFTCRQLRKNPGFTAVAVFTLVFRREPFPAGESSGGALRLGVEQADPRHLSGIDEIPVRANPHHEQVDSLLRRHVDVLRMAHRKHFPVGEVQLKGAERCPITHFLEVRDFHNRAVNVDASRQIFN